MRSFASFGSSNKSFVLNISSERLNCSKVAKGLFVSKVLKGVSLASKAIINFFASFGSLNGPFIVN